MAAETGLPDAVVAALKRGNKIEAIKLLREQIGAGLKEAKDAVDASGIEPDNKSAPDRTSSGAGLWRAVVVVLLVFAGWYFSR